MPQKPTYEELEQRVLELEKFKFESKMAVDALREDGEGKKYINIHKIPTAVVIHNADTRIIDCNPKALELLGLTEDQMLGKTAIDPDWKFLNSDGARMPLKEYPVIQVLAKKKSIRDLTAGICRPHKTDPVWVLVSADPVFDHDGNIQQVIVIFLDITERKRAEDALNRMNRQLRAISTCNQLLMQASDEQTLLNEICRIVCEEAGYRMAWVGYPQNDEIKTIRPMAWAGAEEGYLAADITWAATEHDQELAGQAISGGSSACIQNLATDPHAVHWRERALQRGYHSGIALPLKDESGPPFGALCIYSAQPGTFTLGERTILDELAENLAFRITTLRIRAEHKKTEMQTLASEQLFRALVENSPDFIARYDREFRRIYVNPAIQKLFEGQAENALDKTPTDQSPLYAPKIYIDHLSQAVETATESTAEIPYRTVQGEIHWGHIRFVPEFGSDGHVVSVLAIGRDIHEIKKNEQRFRMLAENFPDFVARFDRAGHYTYVNPAVEKAFGLPAEAIIGKSLRELPQGRKAEQNDVLLNLIQLTFDKGVANESEVHWDTEIGERIYEIRHAPEKDAAGSVVSVLSIARDITERKQSEASIRKLSQVVEQSPVSIIITDVSGKIEFVNAKFTEITSYSFDEVLGQNPRMLKSGETSDEKYRQLWQTISTGGVWQGELHNRKKNGEFFWEQATIAPFRNASNIITHYVAIKEDITERRRLEEQLRQSQKMESVGQLAGGVAHDFNNMLGVILGRAELAMMNADPMDPTHSALKEIHKAAQRSADLVRQLLAFARKQTVAPKALKLNETVASMLKMLLRLIGEEINLVWKPGAGVWPVKMDPSQIDQLLANLCINARDAIAGVGKVTIETANMAFDEAYCTVHPGFKPGDYVMLAVSDDGCGITADVKNHVFEPYFTTKDTGKGTGLGLATVYGIVKQNQGFINVYSEPGNGSTFKIYLPRFAEGAVEAISAGTAVALTGHGETLLFVEDEPAILEVGRTMLEQLGYRVLTAATPKEALRQARTHATDIQLLITDVVMPEMNGRQLEKLISNIKPELKCLFTSGYPANVIAHRDVLEKGVNFLPKPFALEDLALKVRQALEQE